VPALVDKFALQCYNYATISDKQSLHKTINRLKEIKMADFASSSATLAEVCEATGLSYRDMAYATYDAFIAEYYRDGEFTNADFWDNAEIFETVVDAFERTGDEKFLAHIREISAATIKKNGNNWAHNIYNDDIMWLVIAYTRAYMLTGIGEFLDYAKENFHVAWERSYDDALGGGLWWRTDRQCKNACICGPGSIAACLLGKVTGDERYFEGAASVMDWVFKTLFEPDTGRVYDCINIDGSINRWASTYNQGTFIGACTLLWEHTGDEKYLNYAKKAADFALNEMYAGGVMNNETAGGDLIGFKGILTRWLRKFALKTDSHEYIDWLRLNAAAAWSNRNKDGLIWTAWGDKTSDDISEYDVFGMSTAVALMFNCIK
jgi:predicted alpha-1,6-mannanase (GH76 family)